VLKKYSLNFKNILLKVLNNSSSLFISIFISVIFFSIIIALLGYNVFQALNTLIFTSFSSYFSFCSTIIKTIPILFLSYAYAIPSMVQFFNIGSFGQMIFSGTVVTVFSFFLGNLESFILIPILIIIGIFSGGIYALIAANLKIKNNIDPIISTIMLNFISEQFLYYIAGHPYFADPIAGHPTTRSIPKNALLGFYNGIPYYLIFALISIFFIYFFVQRSKKGYELLAVGRNINASNIFGININNSILWAFFLGGCFSGLAGTLEIININGKLIAGFASTNGIQLGLFGTLAALIAGSINPIALSISAFFMSVLMIGANALQRTMGISVFIVFICQALIVISIVTIREIFKKRS